jgi:hypothetical protein
LVRHQGDHDGNQSSGSLTREQIAAESKRLQK